MAVNFLEQLQGIDLGKGLSSAKPLGSLTELANAETADERAAGRLEGLSSQLQASTPLTAILKGVTQGMAGEKRTKAEQERSEKLAAIAAQTEHQRQQGAWLDEVKMKLETSKLAELERLQNQSGIDEGLRLAVDYGDGTAIAEIVRANPGMQGVLDDTLPDGVKFEGVNFDKQNGTLVPFGRDPDGNVHYGQGQKWERFASPEFMQQRAQALYEGQLQNAQLATERAQGDAARALAEQRRAPAPTAVAGSAVDQNVPIDGGLGAAPAAGSQGATAQIKNDNFKAVAANAALNAALDDYNNAVKTYGVQALPGVGKDALNTARRNVQLQMKELYNLGVLNGPDLELMEQMLVGSTVNGAGDLLPKAYEATFTDVPGRVDANVAQLKKQFADIIVSRGLPVTAPAVGVSGTVGATTASPAAEATKVINGVTYIKSNGQWFEQ